VTGRVLGGERVGTRLARGAAVAERWRVGWKSSAPSSRDPFRRRLLATADAFAGASASGVLVFGTGSGAAWSLLLLPGWIVAAKLHGLYDRDHRALRHLTVDEIGSICAWALTGTAGLTAFSLVTATWAMTLESAALVWAAAASAVVVLRAGARALWRRLTPPERTLIIGSGAAAEATRRKLELFPDIHARPVAQVDGLPQLVGVDRVILATTQIGEGLLAELLPACRRAGAKLSVVLPVRGLFGTAAKLSRIADLPVLDYNTSDVSRSTLFLKRSLDLIASVLALVVLAPLVPFIAVAIKLDSRGPVLFSQRRAGLRGRPFTIRKFRTMVDGAEERLPQVVDLDHLSDPMFKLERDPRVTTVGRFLRRTSLDELPQLLNVVRGEMSLVGPRPEQIDVVQRYRPEHRFRLDVKPGITGPMQVYGRGLLTFEERLSVERDYVESLSFGRDLRILLLTLPAVVRGSGAY
jgi:exopolysaccharide biosynthesis polyprenyl glycosylphosphotransferase